jgi:thiol-disulfide isomerase/thioredoxin
MLDFWATWCGPCHISAPYIERFTELHKKDGLITLGLNMDDDTSHVFEFVQKMKLSYPVLLAAQSSLSSDYGVQGLPSFVLIDAQGRAVQLFEGFSPDMPAGWEAEFQHMQASSH